MTVPMIWRKIPQYYNLEGTKCKECGELFFPPRNVCLNCGCQDFEKYNFKGKGKIVTYTIIRSPVQDPEGEIIDKPARETPYVLAIVNLEEGPSLTTEIVDC